MNTRSIQGRLIAGAASGAVALTMLAGATTAIAADHAVDIAGFAFAPQTLTVAIGDIVTWANADAQGHTATADDGAFDTGTIAGGSSDSVTMTTAGTFAYHCSIHPAMTATITVAAAATPGATTPPTDTLAPATTKDASNLPAFLLGLAALLGLELGRRRFAHAPAER